MADTKLSALTSLTTPAFADYLYISDESEGTAADRSKKVTVGNFLANTALSGLTPAAGVVSASDGPFGAFQKIAGVTNNLLNFRDTAALNADATISINAGATPILRVIGSTTFVELSTSRIQRNVTNSSLALLGGLAKGSGAFVEVHGDTSSTVGLVQLVTKGVGSGEGNFQIYNNAVGSASGDLRVSMANDGSWANTPTWNSGGTTFTAWKVNLTDTASAAASLLLALQVSSTSLFTVAKTGATRIIGTSAATSLLHCSTDTTATGVIIAEQASADPDPFKLNFRKTRGTVASPSAITVGDCLGAILFRGYSGAGGYVTSAQIRADSTGTIATTRVASSLVFSTATDAAPSVLTDRLTIDNLGDAYFQTAGIFEIRKSTTAQLARIYETADAGVAAPTNYSRLSLTTQAGNHLIRTEAGGTGTLRTLQVGTGPSVGTNIAGVSTIWHAGQGTGTGAGGSHLFQVVAAGSSGVSNNALATAVTFGMNSADFSYGGLSIKLGADDALSIRTDSTTKVARIVGAHYTNSQAPVGLIISSSQAASNQISYGGGSGSTNAATLIRWFTAANTTTLTGTERFGIDSAGIVSFGGQTSSFPSLKRSSAELQVRLADDSAFGSFQCGQLSIVDFNVVLGTTTGTKIATATTQKLSFWNQTPVTQPTGISDVTGGAVVDAESRTAINSLIAKLESIGLLAVA